MTKAYVVESPENAGFTEGWDPGTMGPDQVTVKVLACGLNFADLLMIRGEYQDTPTHSFAPGMEICGEITNIGEDVTGFTTGKRITAFIGSGGLAEIAVIDAERCRPVPDTMPTEVAAGFQIAYGTSHLALTRRGRLAPGETLVVLGAAGGVGLTAVEIGHALGARVIAVARGDEKLDVARRAGADLLIDANHPDVLSELRTHGPIDVCYDAVGGALGQAALRAMAPEGRFLVIGFASGDVPRAKLNHLMVKNVDVIGFYWGGYMRFNPTALTDSLSDLMQMYERGEIAPHISHVLPFAQVEDGFDLLRRRKSTGKVVITL